MNKHTTSNVPDKSAVLQTFLEVEASLHLLEQEEAGIHYWELARYPVYRELLVKLGIEAPSSEHEPKTLSWWLRFLKLLILMDPAKNPDNAPGGAIVCLGHPRRKLEGGTYHDIYLDPLIALMPNETFVVLERPLGWLTHFTPAATEHLYYLDRKLIGPILKRWLLGTRLSPKCAAHCRQVEAQLTAKLGLSVNVTGQVKNALARYRTEVPMYRKLLASLKPKAVLQVVSGGNETFVAAAHDLGFKVGELQHGSPAPGKLNYDYPAGYFKRNFPDFFFSFGHYWARQVKLPLPSERIVPLGFPYLARQRATHDDVKRRDQVLVLSQPAVSKHLITFTRELAQYLKAHSPHVRIIYKLHPQESREMPGYRDLAALGVEFAAKQSDLYALFAASRWQLGVYSTALYEGLCMGCVTYILDAPGAEFMRPLVEAGHATVIATPGQMTFDAANTPAASAEDLFCSVDVEQVRGALDRLTR